MLTKLSWVDNGKIRTQQNKQIVEVLFRTLGQQCNKLCCGCQDSILSKYGTKWQIPVGVVTSFMGKCIFKVLWSTRIQCLTGSYTHFECDVRIGIIWSCLEVIFSDHLAILHSETLTENVLFWLQAEGSCKMAESKYIRNHTHVHMVT